LSEGLSGVVVATIEAHRVVDGEPGMPPAQEGLGELIRDETQVQEEADGTSAKAFAERLGVVDGEVVELAVEVESALQDQGVEVWVEAK
jgi:hypothetical protein